MTHDSLSVSLSGCLPRLTTLTGNTLTSNTLTVLPLLRCPMARPPGLLSVRPWQRALASGAQDSTGGAAPRRPPRLRQIPCLRLSGRRPPQHQQTLTNGDGFSPPASPTRLPAKLSSSSSSSIRNFAKRNPVRNNNKVKEIQTYFLCLVKNVC